MLRSWIPAVLLVVAVVAGFVAWTSADDATRPPGERAATENRETPAAPAPKGVPKGPPTGGTDEERAAEDCREREHGGEKEIKVGSFERPENTPDYEVLKSERYSRNCARGAYLLVDTRSHDKAGYELIARDVKARHAGLDAVSVEFTDTTGTLAYEGAAIVFNTPAGISYLGFVYGPPNNKGYLVEVAD